MLANVLALAVALGSIALYLTAFVFPALHRKQDFIWSGVGLFYALVLWVCASRITGAVLLGQTASVALLGWLGWQTLSLRSQLASPDGTSSLPKIDGLTTKILSWANDTEGNGVLSKVKGAVGQAIAGLQRSQSSDPAGAASAQTFGGLQQKVLLAIATLKERFNPGSSTPTPEPTPEPKEVYVRAKYRQNQTPPQDEVPSVVTEAPVEEAPVKTADAVEAESVNSPAPAPAEPVTEEPAPTESPVEAEAVHTAEQTSVEPVTEEPPAEAAPVETLHTAEPAPTELTTQEHSEAEASPVEPAPVEQAVVEPPAEAASVEAEAIHTPEPAPVEPTVQELPETEASPVEPAPVEQAVAEPPAEAASVEAEAIHTPEPAPAEPPTQELPEAEVAPAETAPAEPAIAATSTDVPSIEAEVTPSTVPVESVAQEHSEETVSAEPTTVESPTEEPSVEAEAPHPLEPTPVEPIAEAASIEANEAADHPPEPVAAEPAIEERLTDASPSQAESSHTEESPQVESTAEVNAQEHGTEPMVAPPSQDQSHLAQQDRAMVDACSKSTQMVIQGALQEAAFLGFAEIRTQDLLVGFLRVDNSNLAFAKTANITLGGTRTVIEANYNQGGGSSIDTGEVRFSSSARNVLQNAVVDSERKNTLPLHPAQLLLALVQSSDPDITGILEELQVDLEKLQGHLQGILTSLDPATEA